MRISAVIPYLSGQDERFGPALRLFMGIPLFQRSVLCALESEIFHRVMVLSDDKELLAEVEALRSDSSVQVCQVDPEWVPRLVTIGDVFELGFSMDPTADCIGVLFPKYPLRRPGRIKREVAPALLARQAEWVEGRSSFHISTFDYWMRVENGYTPVFSYYDQYVALRNQVYCFSQRGTHYQNFAAQNACPNEMIQPVITSYGESIAVSDDVSLNYAERVTKVGEPICRRIKRHRSGPYNVVIPETVELDSFISLLRLEGGEGPKPILTPAPAKISELPLHAVREADMHMHAEVYRRVMDSQKGPNPDGSIEYFIQNPFYRVILERYEELQLITTAKERSVDPLFVPEGDVLLQSTCERWEGYVNPFEWEGDDNSEQKT